MNYHSTKRIPIIFVTIGILLGGFYWGYQASVEKKPLLMTAGTTANTAASLTPVSRSTTLVLSPDSTTLLFPLDSNQSSLSVKPSLHQRGNNLPVVLNFQFHIQEANKVADTNIAILPNEPFTFEIANNAEDTNKTILSGMAHLTDDQQVELQVNYLHN